MKRNLILIIYLVLLTSGNVWAAAPYTGGSYDGYSELGYTMPGSPENPYLGGSYDGYAMIHWIDSDGDGLPDFIETGCTNPFDADSDDDGIVDGDEDADHDGDLDVAETDPCDEDTDFDGIQDGTEVGVTTGHETDTGGTFIPDADPLTTTDPRDDDSDDDGWSDGQEDTNYNGQVDEGESDPDDPGSTPGSTICTLSASDSGRYSAAGFHDPDNTDYAAIVGGTNNFFVFDLTGITDQRPILCATLMLNTGTVSGGTFGGITYTLYDVTTPVETLVAGGDGLTLIYDDLGSGVPYSAATAIEPGTSNTEISIPLLPAGVAAVETAKGGLISIGGGPTGLGGNLAFGGTDVFGAVLTIELSNPEIPSVSDFAAAYGSIFPDSNYAEFYDVDDDGDVDGNDLSEFTASFE